MDTSLILAMALLGSPPSVPSHPDSICSVTTGNEAKVITWLRGDYAVLGSRNGQPYTGQLTLSGAEDAESLEVTGTVDGSPRQGMARYVRCGPDQVMQLEVVLGPEQGLYCIPHNDYDNLNRASCSRSLSDPSGDQELWVQRVAS